MSITFTCECGKRLSVKDELAGKKGKCPGCGKLQAIPLESEPEPVPEPQPVEEPEVKTQPCPHCGKPIPLGAVFCTLCGTHLVTGEKHEAHAPEKVEHYDPLQMILPTVQNPGHVVGVIVDSPLSAATFWRTLVLFAVGAVGITLLWSTYSAPENQFSLVKWYYFPLWLTVAGLILVIDTVTANLAGKHFGSTGTTLAHTVIALMILNGVWGLGCAAMFVLAYFNSMVATYVPWLLFLWSAYMLWVTLIRAYDMGQGLAITFAVGANALKMLLAGLVTHILSR